MEDFLEGDSLEEELLATPEFLPGKLMKAKIAPPKVSSEEVTRETGLEESNAVLGKVIVDEVADVEKERADKFEIPRKKLVKVPIKPKAVLMALLAEEKELEDAEAMRKAIDDVVAEIHEQEQRSEVMFEILQDHSESPESGP